MGRPPGGASNGSPGVEPPAGVELVRGDLSEPTALEPALDGVDVAFLLWPQASAQGHGATVELLTARVSRIVYLSSLSIRDDLEQQTHPMTAIHADIERAIERAGSRWTFLRAGKFDTVVIGSRGLGALDRMLQGSVSEHVATHADATVIVAR